ncbi:MAG TPA: ParB/RepB/Spo0J family partition protein [Thermoanaerobaculia bacterium]
MNQKKALGRGLSALIPQKSEPAIASGALAQIPLDRISANPYQPRKAFNERSIDELTRSVREYGIVQPLVVTRTADNRFRLIAGERRFRAAQKAGLQSVPAVIKDLQQESERCRSR